MSAVSLALLSSLLVLWSEDGACASALLTRRRLYSLYFFDDPRTSSAGYLRAFFAILSCTAAARSTLHWSEASSNDVSVSPLPSSSQTQAQDAHLRGARGTRGRRSSLRPSAPCPRASSLFDHGRRQSEASQYHTRQDTEDGPATLLLLSPRHWKISQSSPTSPVSASSKLRGVWN